MEAGRANQFVKESIFIQYNLAIKVKTELNVNKIYLYDNAQYFKDAEQFITVDGIRYLSKDSNLAVLSATAQKVFKIMNEYTQFTSFEYQLDKIGVFV